MCRLLLTGLLLSCVMGLWAQTEQECEVDSAFIESGAIVSPPPFQDDTLVRFLPSACIDQPYELTLVVNPPAQLEINNLSVVLTSIRIDSVVGLPKGITIECTAPNCLFLPDEVNCIFLSGTPTDENPPGVYEPRISLTAVALGFPIPLEFPNPALAPGSYIIELLASGEACLSTSNREHALRPAQYRVFPNPVSERLAIQWQALQAGTGTIEVRNVAGQVMLSHRVQMQAGWQIEELSLADLPGGIYVVGLRSEQGSFYTKMIKAQ